MIFGISHTALNLPGRSNWTIFPWSFQCKSPLPGSSTKLRALRAESPRFYKATTTHDVSARLRGFGCQFLGNTVWGKEAPVCVTRLSHTTLEEHLFSCNPAGVSHSTPVVSGNLHMNVTFCFSFKEQNNNAMPMAEAWSWELPSIFLPSLWVSARQVSFDVLAFALATSIFVEVWAVPTSKVWWPDSRQTRQIQNCGLDTFGIYESARYWITGSMQSTCICWKTSLAPPSSLCLQEAVAKKISSPQLHFSVTTRWLDSSGDAELQGWGLAWNWLWNQGWDLLDNSSEIDPKTCRNPHYKLGASWCIRYMMYMASRRISRPINLWASRVGTNVDSIPRSKSLKLDRLIDSFFQMQVSWTNWHSQPINQFTIPLGKKTWLPGCVLFFFHMQQLCLLHA